MDRPSTGLATSVIAAQEKAATGKTEIKKFQDPEFRAALANTTRKFALNCTLAFIYFRVSFLHEFVASRTGFDTHVMLILGGLACLGILMSGTALTALRYKPALMWVLFVGCMCIATLFSSWRGGSVNLLLPYLRTTFPLILLIPATAFTSKDIEKAITAIGFAGATTILIGLVSSDSRSGRAGMNANGGTIQDPNDYAAHMLLVIPAVAYVMMRRDRNVFMKVFGIGLIAAAFFEFLGTGSRGGLVALIVMGLYILKKGSNKIRLGLIFGIPILCAFALPFIPSDSAQRLASVFDSSKAPENAADSREARIFLLKESIRITLHHPVLGIGPGEFQDFQGGMAAAKGEQGAWHSTHNAYTQVSSECGIPALAFFVSAMILTFRSLGRAKNLAVASIKSIANTLSIMMVGYSAAIFFLSHGYGFALLIITGLSVCIQRLLAQESSVISGTAGV